jgi:hypothetical protein
MKKKSIKIKCPYCGARADLRPASVVHGESGDGYLWVCARYPRCDSYVGVHQQSREPLGTLADKALRRKRMEAHRVFNRLWEDGYMSKSQAYIWMRAIFGLNREQAHIGMFSEYMCGEVIAACARFLRNNRREGAA